VGEDSDDDQAGDHGGVQCQQNAEAPALRQTCLDVHELEVSRKLSGESLREPVGVDNDLVLQDVYVEQQRQGAGCCRRG